MTAEMKTGADRSNRDAPVVERNRVKDVTVRRVVEQRIQLAAIGVEVKRDVLRDREKILGERTTRALRHTEQAKKIRGVILLASRNARGPFGVELQQQAADLMRVAAASRDARLDGLGGIDGLQVHREIAAMTRGLGEPARRVLENNRPRIARDEPAAAAAALGQQTIAAEQRAITDDEDCAIERHRAERIIRRDQVARAASGSIGDEEGLMELAKPDLGC